MDVSCVCVVCRMSILSSREHTCIHKQVSKSATKNEACKLLLEVSRREFITFCFLDFIRSVCFMPL